MVLVRCRKAVAVSSHCNRGEVPKRSGIGNVSDANR